MIFNEPYEINIRNKRWWTGEGEYVGRPKSGGYSPLGNPFPMNANRTREEAIAAYDEWFEEQLKSNVQVQDEVVKLVAILLKEKGLNLICWCSPEKCHAEIIKKKLLEILD